MAIKRQISPVSQKGRGSPRRSCASGSAFQPAGYRDGLFGFRGIQSGRHRQSRLGFQQLESRLVLAGEPQMIKDIQPGVNESFPSFLTAVGNTLYFEADDGVNGSELWKSDGTAAGTVLVKDISPGARSSSPASLTAVGNTLYFKANDGLNGVELWKSDGTAAGTVLVKDISPGAGSSGVGFLTAVGNTLYLSLIHI